MFQNFQLQATRIFQDLKPAGLTSGDIFGDIKNGAKNNKNGKPAILKGKQKGFYVDNLDACRF